MEFSNKILVIDDEEFNLDILQEYIEGAGFQTILSIDGQQGFNELQKNKDVDAIVVDRMMPVMDGISFVKKVKSYPDLKEIPIIMQTAATSPEQVQEGLEAGVYYYLAKPYKKDILITILSAAVVEYREKRELKVQSIKYKQTDSLTSNAVFKFRTIEEARDLALRISQFFKNPEKVVYGLGELLINAVEHGNLGITYEEKKKLIFAGKIEEEINKRLLLPENQDKFAEIYFERTPTHSIIKIKDHGKGFDYKKYMAFSPERALDPNGRGIASSKIMSFDEIEYLGCGNEVIAKVVDQKVWG